MTFHLDHVQRSVCRNEHGRSADRDFVPPTPSIWTAVVTAAAAFAGVLLAQWWTTRREDRNWQRQMQMYATQWDDQRTRDAEQREEQRQRDRELWAREDQHRFTEHKRDVYARQLSALRSLRESIVVLLREVGNAGGDPADASARLKRVGQEFINDTYNRSREANLINYEVFLLGHPSITKEVMIQFENLLDAQHALLLHKNAEEARTLLGKHEMAKILQMMRADLSNQPVELDAP